MTNEEIFKNGDYNTLYEKNKKYIFSLIKKYPNLEKENVISCGNLGFAKAIKGYSLENGVKFLTYASVCIRNEILMFIRKMKKRDTEISLFTNIRSSDNNLILIDTISDDSNFVETIVKEQELKYLQNAIDILPKRQKQLIKLRLQGKTQKEIAKKMNVTQSYISRLEKNAHQKLYKLIN